MKSHSEQSTVNVAFRIEFGLFHAAALQVASLVLLLHGTLSGDVTAGQVYFSSAMAVGSLTHASIKGVSAWNTMAPVLAVGFLLIRLPLFDLFIWVLLVAFVTTGRSVRRPQDRDGDD